MQPPQQSYALPYESQVWKSEGTFLVFTSSQFFQVWSVFRRQHTHHTHIWIEGVLFLELVFLAHALSDSVTGPNSGL